MLFSILIISSFSRRPIYLISGFVGSALYATITQPELYPQCPSNLHHFQFFPINPTFYQQFPQCIGTLLSTVYNSENNSISSPQGIQIETDSIGNVTSLVSYSRVVGRLISEGYTVNKTLFGVPYDWVHYYPGTPTLFTDIINHIENIFNKTGEKAILFGHSLGSHVIRLLFSNYTDSKWIEKHIDRVILNAPAFYGCFDLVERVINGILDNEKEIDQSVAFSIRHMPSAFALFENYNIFENKFVFSNFDGDQLSGVHPKDVHTYLRKINLFDDASMQIFSLIQPSLIQKPFEFPVPTILFYNSGLPSPVSFNGTTLERISGKGDGFCQSDIIETLCSQWKHTKCVNWNSDDTKFGHVQMLSSKEEINMISKFINNHDEL